MRLVGITTATFFLLSIIGQTASSQAPAQAQRTRRQLPDKFTNLQVLPKGISKEQLVDTMRLFSRSLGVHCDHCHEVSEQSADWASDKNENKLAARTMLKMVRDINANYMPKSEPLPGEQSGDKVNCWTCHRGQKEPAEGPPAEEHREGPPPGMGPAMGQPSTPPGM